MKKQLLIKRAIDILVASAGLIILSPLFITIALSIRLKMGSPVLFRQARPGLNGHLFHIYKFRTMIESQSRNGNILSDDDRLTDFGRFLRSTSLDELPELFNVLRGEMSIVGPRPLLPEYLELYSPEQRHRHNMKPGLTGWAQVSGRNEIEWKRKFELDVWYIDNWSLFLDLKILLLSIKKVISREGISAQGEATAPRFTGDN